MITYAGGAFGYRVLLRLHGSAAFKSLTPSLLSSAIYVVLYHFFFRSFDDDDEAGDGLFDHPYPMGALVTAFSFLLVFRANYSYNRYWEACTAVYLMHSKWLDFATELAAFHLQSDQYERQKPPAFGAHPGIKTLMTTRERERRDEMTKQELFQHVEEMVDPATNPNIAESHGFRAGLSRVRSRFRKRNGRKDSHATGERNKRKDEVPYASFRVVEHERLRAGHVNDPDDDSPCLFLEEVAHLLSLMSAVAVSTLRNDSEEAESPLMEFVPGLPWPKVDPDAYSDDVRRGWSVRGRVWVTVVRYLCGVSRNNKSRTLYNAARPFRVIGNVSDAEISLLQAARGPQAKVALCSMWLQEFLSREYMSGSTGRVAPPIISRLYQYVSEGMAGYNQARKIAYIPFPFPHAQITTLFVLVIVAFIPVLVLDFVQNEYFGFFLNLITVMCFTGLHEVARELENPFQNVPNDIPLNNYQAQFNEGLLVMFFGYHPDAHWEQFRPTIAEGIPPHTDEAEEEADSKEERSEPHVQIEEPAIDGEESRISSMRREEPPLEGLSDREEPSICSINIDPSGLEKLD